MGQLGHRIGRLEGVAGHRAGADLPTVRGWARGVLELGPEHPLVRTGQAAAEGAETPAEYCRRFWQAVIGWLRSGDGAGGPW